MTREEIESELDPKLYIGRCVSQVEEFNETVVKPLLAKYHTEEIKADLKV